MADVHAAKNGYVDHSTGLLKPETEAYLDAMGQSFLDLEREGMNIHVERLSNLYKRHNLTPITEEGALQDEEANEKFGKHKDFLQGNARRYSVTGAGSDVDGIRYVAMRIREKAILDQDFSNSILLAAGISKGASDIILPDNRSAIFLGGKSPWFQH